jgi:putative transposase
MAQLDQRRAGIDVEVPWTLPELRRDWNRAKHEAAPWWAENSKEAYSSGLDSLARALKNFSDSKAGRRKGRPMGFPRRKQKGRCRDACRFTTGPLRVEADRKHVTLPRIGLLKTHESTRKLARRLAVLSTGEVILNPHALRHSLRKLRRLNQELHRRTPGSRRRAQTQRKLAGVHARAANLRRDALHKLTSSLATRHGTIVIEQLNLAGMVRNRRLARAIADTALGELRRQLAYKTTWYGSRLIVADRFYPSSKTCSAYGWVKAKLTLAERNFTCEACGLRLDRDLNAARNLAGLVRITKQMVVAGSGPETGNACVRDCQSTSDGGRSGNPDTDCESGGSRKPAAFECKAGTAGR